VSGAPRGTINGYRSFRVLSLRDCDTERSFFVAENTAPTSVSIAAREVGATLTRKRRCCLLARPGRARQPAAGPVVGVEPTYRADARYNASDPLRSRLVQRNGFTEYPGACIDSGKSRASPSRSSTAFKSPACLQLGLWLRSPGTIGRFRHRPLPAPGRRPAHKSGSRSRAS
jgi:hypothetical protein